MELSNIEQEEKPLLGRTNVTCKLFYKGVTPSTNEIAEALSKELKKPREQLAVQSVYNTFGDTKATVVTHVYESKEALEKLEPAHQKKKNAPAPKPEDSPAEKPEEPQEAASEEGESSSEEASEETKESSEASSDEATENTTSAEEEQDEEKKEA